MSLTKRIKGDFTIENVDTGSITLRSAESVIIDGDLTVLGDTISVESTNTTIVDNVIILNSGETGAGITAASGTAGIEVDRGTALDVGLRFNESTDAWEATNDGTNWYLIDGSATAGLTDIVYDVTPQLGGNLDVNGFTITSASGDIVIDASGLVKVEQELTLKEQTVPPSAAGYNKLYANTTGKGGTGLYYINDSGADELVSKTKAILYSLIY